MGRAYSRDWPLTTRGVQYLWSVHEFLTWVGRCPRTYADAMEAWRSSCPRYTVWEDAHAAGLIHVADGGPALDSAPVTLTPRGQAVLGRQARAGATSVAINFSDRSDFSGVGSTG